MKANANKCHFLITTNKERDISIVEEKIKNSKSEKFLGVTIDNKRSMYIKYVIKLVKSLTHWLNYVVS